MLMDRNERRAEFIAHTDIQGEYELCVEMAERTIGTKLNIIEKAALRRIVFHFFDIVISPADLTYTSLDLFFERYLGTPFLDDTIGLSEDITNKSSEKYREWCSQQIELHREETYLL